MGVTLFVGLVHFQKRHQGVIVNLYNDEIKQINIACIS